MTIYKITPQFINGSVLVPSSKSMGHRMCICAGLSGRNCIVDNIAISKDIEATNRCLEGLGVTITEVASLHEGRTAFQFHWLHKFSLGPVTVDCGNPVLRCGFIPLGALCNRPFTFKGQGNWLRGLCSRIMIYLINRNCVIIPLKTDNCL